MGAALRGPRWPNDEYETPLSILWKMVPNFVLEGQKWSKLWKAFPFKKRHEAHQIDWRNVLNTKMYVVGVKNVLFFKDQKWSKLAKSSWPSFLIVILPSG